MDFVSEIERLVTRRAQAETELASLNDQLDRVRTAIGLPSERPMNMAHRHNQRGKAASRALILEALAKAEPQRTDMLKRNTGIQSVSYIAAAMVKDKAIVRKMDINGARGKGGGFWYARTEGAFVGHPDVAIETEAPAEAADVEG